MEIEGLSGVPAPPDLPDLYDEISLPSDLDLGPSRSGTVTAAAVLAFVLSIYGFYVGLVSLRAWFSPGPFCDSDCLTGVVYGALLLVPGIWGIFLGFALLARWRWAYVAGLATFALFALENAVRVNYLEVASLSLGSTSLRYQLLFIAFAVSNAAGLALLLLPASQRDFDRRSKPAETRTPSDDSFEMAVQVSSVAADESTTRASLPTLAAATVLLAVLLGYRVPDLAFHFDLLGAYSVSQPLIPRRLSASPISTLVLGWGFVLAFGLYFRRRWARVLSIVTSSLFIAAMVPLASACLIGACAGGRLGRELVGLLAGNVAIVILLFMPGARHDFRVDRSATSAQ